MCQQREFPIKTNITQTSKVDVCAKICTFFRLSTVRHADFLLLFHMHRLQFNFQLISFDICLFNVMLKSDTFVVISQSLNSFTFAGMEEPKGEKPLENGHATVQEPSEVQNATKPEEERSIKVEETSELLSTAIKEEINVDHNAKTETPPELCLTTKNLERVREELRQEEILQGRKSPFKIETASSSPVKLETVLKTVQSLLDTILTPTFLFYRSSLKSAKVPPLPQVVTNPVIIGPHLIITTTEIEKKIGIEVAVEVIEAVTTENDTMLECNAKSEINISLSVVNQ